ncbi:MAG: DUF2752 domain-containing protein [Phycisphaerae bacterium]|jgi:hypothetical protein
MENGCAIPSVGRVRCGWPAGAVRRLGGATVSALAVAVLLVAGALRPEPGGVGTHEQLNLPACSFLVRTGWPCPTCGLTTSLAAMAHGNVALAFSAQPFGVVIFLALIAAAVAGGVEALSRRPVFSFPRPAAWWVLAAAGGLVGGWAIKLAVGLACGRWPVR